MCRGSEECVQAEWKRKYTSADPRHNRDEKTSVIEKTVINKKKGVFQDSWKRKAAFQSNRQM